MLLSKGEDTSLQPSNRYLASSRIPSTYVDDSSSHRKLLVLDLNGTLVYRPKPRLNQKHGGPGLRAAHPRPYMPSFCRYLDHSETRKWLDAMVWSSAQPHSVADMVDKCFAGVQERFLAIWARDTFGLKPEDYEKKVLTVKDLTSIWNTFSQHSSSSTVLLDDSPSKAQLQPWNHIVLTEYTRQMRAHDLKVWDYHQILDPLPSGKKHKKKEAKRAAKNVHADSESPAPESSEFQGNTSEPTSTSHLTESAIEAILYDETILAIVGILEALKTQSNVAHWLRCGELGLINPGNSSRLEVSSPYWFHNRVVVQGWVEKGRSTLVKLGIDLEPGIRG